MAGVTVLPRVYIARPGNGTPGEQARNAGWGTGFIAGLRRAADIVEDDLFIPPHIKAPIKEQLAHAEDD